MHVALTPQSLLAKGSGSTCPAAHLQPRRVPISTCRQVFRGDHNVYADAHRSIGRRASHRSALAVRCVQDVTEKDFEQEVLKVRFVTENA